MNWRGWREVARRRGLRRARGFTLLEIAAALVLLGIMAGIAVPSLVGYVSSSEPRGFEADKRLLQAAVDAWRTDVANRTGTAWPTVGGIQGPLADGSNNGVDVGSDSSVIRLDLLASAGYIAGTDSVKSFAYSTSVTSGTGATNDPVGTYVWYVDANGSVQGRAWTDSATNPGRIDASELNSSDGLVSGRYP